MTSGPFKLDISEFPPQPLIHSDPSMKSTAETEDTANLSHELEFTDLLNSFGDQKSQMIKNDDKLQKKLCEHLCGRILRGEIGQKDSSI